MSLSEKGLRIGRALVQRALELGIDIKTATPKRMAILFDLLPQELVEQAVQSSPELDRDDVLTVFIRLLVSQLPENRPQKSIAPWAKKPKKK